MEYKYYINNIEVFPLNKGTFKFSFKKPTKSAVFLEKSLDTTIEFSYQSGTFNFKTQEEEYPCKENSFEVKRDCGEGFESYYRGVFYISEGKFDNDRCTYSVKIRNTGEMIDDVEVNLMHAPGAAVSPGLIIQSIGFTTPKYFYDVLIYAAKKTNSNIVDIVSNFFQINPDGPATFPLLNSYTLLFDAVSNIQFPPPTNQATVCNVTFKQLMDDLQVLFDVWWYVDEYYNIRIEHRTWFLQGSGLDLTLPEFEKFMRASDHYETDYEDITHEEKWKIAGHYQDMTVKYLGLPVIKKNTNSKAYATQKIWTDLNERNIEGGSKDGLFLIAAPAATNEITNISLPDYLLRPEILFLNFHTYSRPSLYCLITTNEKYNPGLYNSSYGYELDSVAPRKSQKEVTFSLCCQDIDMKKKVTTQMGDGVIEKAGFEMFGHRFKLDLLHEVPNCDSIQPSDLPDLDLWLKHNEGFTINGGYVNQWNDASGNGRHATYITVPTRPTKFTDYVYFGPGMSLITPAFQLFPNKRGTIIAVFYTIGDINTSTSGIAALSTQNGGTGNYFDLTVTLGDKIGSVGYATTYRQNIDPSQKQNRGVFIFNRLEDSYVSIWHNGFECVGNTVLISNNQPSSLPLIIGDNANCYPAAGNNFRLMELIVYGRSLSDAEIDQIHYYLTQKGILSQPPI